MLSDLCEPLNITLIILRQYGMIGYLRCMKSVNTIVQRKQVLVKSMDLRVS